MPSERNAATLALETPPFGITSPERVTFSQVVPVPDGPPLEEAYATARKLDAARPQTGAGHRLYFMTRGAMGSVDVRAGAAMVLGRHTHCDVVIERDERVSLRHLLVRSTLLDDGCPQLSLLDLQTSLGMTLANGRRSRSLAATGPLAVRVGAYTLVALPSGEESPDQLPTSVCEAAGSHPFRSPPARRLGESWISMLPDPIEPIATSVGAPSLGAAPYEIAIVSQHGRARILVTNEDLERGLLVGRAPRCANLLAALNNGISRVHVVILRTRAGVVAFDAASTHGTFDATMRRVKRVVLHDQGTALALGPDGAKVSLVWRAR